MTTMVDETHDPALESWVDSANQLDGDFPVQNLPYGVIASPAGVRVGVAIGDAILDLCKAGERAVFAECAAEAANACRSGALNELMALGPPHWRALRVALSRALRRGSPAQWMLTDCLLAAGDVRLELPAQIGDFTDFYASIHHARHTGAMLRPDQPLTPNYHHLPLAYHGRASSIRVSGTPLRRPLGQAKGRAHALPALIPSRRLDFELELGFYVGPGNALGEPIALSDAPAHVFGLCLVNDWSARDFQAWEAQPLGPFLSKSFLTSVSPWVVTLDALAPFRVPAAKRPGDAPPLLPYLDWPQDRESGGLDVALEVLIHTEAMRAQGMEPERIGAPRFADHYWTIFQLVAHHTSNGCNLVPGDLVASGTVSGDRDDELGSLIELTLAGKRPLRLGTGEERRFLEDGDEVIFRGHCRRNGYRDIGFGECRGFVTSAWPDLHGPT